MAKMTRPQVPSAAFLWSALAASSASGFARALAQGFVGLALGPDAARNGPEPDWPTGNKIALELNSVSLRDFSTTSQGPATLVCAPFALHGASAVDFAANHSLVGALVEAGLTRVFVTDWRSADADMRFFSIDTYLADLNVMVDQLGGVVDLIGLCQGGWLALTYAARFPHKVGKVVLAGAPVDIEAGSSPVSERAKETPLSVFRELVTLGDGRMLGRHALQFWGPAPLDAAALHALLQALDPIGSAHFRRLEARFRRWHAWTVDLPGRYYLDVVERLFKQNQLAAGGFVALGREIKLRDMRAPIFLLAARDDEVVAPAQLFATERLVGTPAGQVEKLVAPTSHLGLFMNRDVLTEIWPRIAHWLSGAEAESRSLPARLHGRDARRRQTPSRDHLPPHKAAQSPVSSDS